MFYIVYRTVNTINGRFYIGVHQTNHLDDFYIGSGVLLKTAVRKYGKENFTREIIKICETEEEMFRMEEELVVTNDENPMSYNVATGGRSGGNNRRAFLMKTDSEYRTTVIENIKCGLQKYKEKNGHLPFEGSQHTEKVKRRIGEHNKTHTGGTGFSGKMWVFDPQTNKNLVLNKDEQIPEGYVKGKYQKPKNNEDCVQN
jgi:hypothetical protein